MSSGSLGKYARGLSLGEERDLFFFPPAPRGTAVYGTCASSAAQASAAPAENQVLQRSLDGEDVLSTTAGPCR